MDKEKEVKDLAQKLFENSKSQYHICGECSSLKCQKDNKPLCGNFHRVAEAVIGIGYGNVKQYQEEIARLETELMHREEDLVHADEKVFYREVAVKLEEDKIKKQAVKEFAEKLKKKIKSISDIGFTGKTEKQLYQRRGMEEGLKMAIEIVDDLILKLYGEEKT